MIKLNVLSLLQQNGKTKYWLYKQMNMSYQNFSKMINNETQSFRYENIEIMCQLLKKLQYISKYEGRSANAQICI